MDISQKTIGIIGFGNFGKVLVNNIFPNNKIILVTTQEITSSEHVTVVKNIEEIKNADIIIPAVPIRNFAETIKKLAAIINPQTIVMDICSVMEYPTKVMQENLPNNPLIATHPMFGPNSIAKKGSMKDMNYVLHNISTPSDFYEAFKDYLKTLGVNIIEITPQEHDRLSAKSQFVSLLIGEITQQLQFEKTIIDTPGAEALQHAVSFSGADRHIIEDMLTYNTFCRPILEEFKKVLSSLEEQK